VLGRYDGGLTRDTPGATSFTPKSGGFLSPL